VTNWIYA